MTDYPYPAPMARRGKFEAHFDGRWLFVAEGRMPFSHPDHTAGFCLPNGLLSVRQLIKTLTECVEAYERASAS